jgi:hypothetical protein
MALLAEAMAMVLAGEASCPFDRSTSCATCSAHAHESVT